MEEMHIHLNSVIQKYRILMLPELCAWWLHINKKVAKADESSIEKKNQCSAN
jgi:hypothetical protein